MAQLKNFNTALYVMQLDAESKYNGLLKIGISNNVERRAKEVGSVKVLYHDAYRAPRSVVMVTEMLAQAMLFKGWSSSQLSQGFACSVRFIRIF